MCTFLPRPIWRESIGCGSPSRALRCPNDQINEFASTTIDVMQEAGIGSFNSILMRGVELRKQLVKRVSKQSPCSSCLRSVLEKWPRRMLTVVGHVARWTSNY